MTLLVIALYFLVVLSFGVLGHRLFRGTSEGYFLANRSIGPFVLLMSLFGTHMTAFALLGSSGEAYRTGIGVFALMASSSALVVPTLFHFIGVRMWRIGKRFGYMTQAHFFRERWQSDLVGTTLFIALIGLLIPYLLVGVMGGGITLNQITEGAIPDWVGSLLVCVVVLIYVTVSGMRGTVWANTFQTLVFMSLGTLAFFVITSELGGLTAALNRVAGSNPELLSIGSKIAPLKMLTYAMIPLSAGMFPHIFAHWLTARSAQAFRYPVAFYPICIAIVWIPTVLLGVLGRIQFPGLEGPAANSVLVQMIQLNAPEILAGLLAAGVFAAVMSSLDSQVLAIGTMFTQNIVKHYGFDDQMSERWQVLTGRIFVGGILAIAFLLSRIVDRSIFSIGVWSFTGFASLLPILIAALFWRRSTRTGALASIATTVVLWLYYFSVGFARPDYTVLDSGILPVAVIFASSALAMVVGSLLSNPPSAEVVGRYFPETGTERG